MRIIASNVFFCFFSFLRQDFLCVALVALELALQTRLTLNSQSYTCLCLKMDFLYLLILTLLRGSEWPYVLNLL